VGRRSDPDRGIHFDGDQVFDTVIERDGESNAWMRACEFEQFRASEHPSEADWHADSNAAA
jgi:hypothetical protein